MSEAFCAATLVFFVLPVPNKRLFKRSMSECRNAFEQAHQMPIAATQMAMAISMKDIGSDLHYLVKEIGSQTDAGGQQLLVELGTDASCSKASNHASIGIQSAFFKYKDVLEGD